MSWVRYDDGFHDHPKVMEARDRDPGSIALHLLANTWSARTKRPGFVPSVLPRQLVGAKGKRWAEILVEAELWNPVEGGWEFHDWSDYAAPGKYRAVAGTPEELSAKRAAAGRKGGRVAQARKQTSKQTGEQNEQLDLANVKQASSNRASPVVSGSVTPYGRTELLTPEPVQPSAAGEVPPAPTLTLNQRSKRITDAYVGVEPMCRWPAVNAVVARAIQAERWSDDEISAALARMAGENRSVTVDSLRIELAGLPPTRPGRHRQDDTNAMFERAIERAQSREASSQ